MPKVRAEWTGEYGLDKHEFYSAYHYAMQYKKWKDKYARLGANLEPKAVTYDGVSVQHSPGCGAVEAVAIERADLLEKMRKVIDAAKEADSEIWEWILKAATTEGATYYSLHNPADGSRPLYCGKKMYYDRRRKFYYYLWRKLA